MKEKCDRCGGPNGGSSVLLVIEDKERKLGGTKVREICEKCGKALTAWWYQTDREGRVDL